MKHKNFGSSQSRHQRFVAVGFWGRGPRRNLFRCEGLLPRSPCDLLHAAHARRRWLRQRLLTSKTGNALPPKVAFVWCVELLRERASLLDFGWEDAHCPYDTPQDFDNGLATECPKGSSRGVQILLGNDCDPICPHFGSFCQAGLPWRELQAWILEQRRSHRNDNNCRGACMMILRI